MSTNQSRIEKYESQYGDLIEVVADSMSAKYGYGWTGNDSIAFGQYADNWMDFKEVLENDATARSDLGPVLDTDLGIVAMSYGSLPIQNIASVQPLNDEAGTIYFRNSVATTTRNGVTKGDKLINTTGVAKVGNYSKEVTSANFIIADTSVLDYTTTLEGGIKPGSFKLNLAGKVKAFDTGEGAIIGVGIDSESSTINYTTGDVVLKFIDLVGKGVVADDVATIEAKVDLVQGEVATPGAKWVLESKTIESDYYILQSSFSTLSEYVVKKKFGAELNNEITADLVAQINSSVMEDAITNLRASALKSEELSGTVINWSMTPSAGTADIDHRATFDDVLIDAVGVMNDITGRGQISAIITGTKGKKIFKTIGMTMYKTGSEGGTSLTGEYDGVPVYYAPATVLGRNEILVIYRGQNWYESALVYAPFLPVTTISGRSSGSVFENASGVFHAAGLESVIDGFVAKINLV